MKDIPAEIYSCFICVSCPRIIVSDATLIIYVHDFYFVKKPPLILQSSIKSIFFVFPQLWLLNFQNRTVHLCHVCTTQLRGKSYDKESNSIKLLNI